MAESCIGPTDRRRQCFSHKTKVCPRGGPAESRKVQDRRGLILIVQPLQQSPSRDLSLIYSERLSAEDSGEWRVWFCDAHIPARPPRHRSQPETRGVGVTLGWARREPRGSAHPL